MGLKKHRPISPGRRFRTTADFSEVTSEKEKKKTKAKAPKKLRVSKNRISGRNVYGRITVRRRGGGHKRHYRVIDFKRDNFGIAGEVVSIDYDPNRNARLALVKFVNGDKRYILCPAGVDVGTKIQAGPDSEIKPGNSMALADIPVGELVHCVELRPKGGAKLIRTAGASAQLMAKDGKYAQLRMPSGEQRKILLTCQATIGVVGNSENANRSLGKAGVSRWLGRRPKVRGVAMNPVDHPHGGGEGKTSGGRHPVTPWGQPTKGYKTRQNKTTDKFIVRRRSKKKRR